MDIEHLQGINRSVEIVVADDAVDVNVGRVVRLTSRGDDRISTGNGEDNFIFFNHGMEFGWAVDIKTVEVAEGVIELNMLIWLMGFEWRSARR